MLVLLSLLACSSTAVKGQVNGDSVPAMSQGYWYSFEGVIYAGATDFPDACETFAARGDAQTEAYAEFLVSFDSEALAAAWTAIDLEYLPESYWTVAYLARVSEGADPTGSYELGGAEGGFGVGHTEGYTDWAAVLAGEAPDNETSAWAISGDSEITAMEDEGALKAKGEAELESEDGEISDVTFTVDAEFCAELQP